MTYVNYSFVSTMPIDHVLILSAGKGTRMGKIGERLPKVLWPVFRYSLLELQYLYAKQFSENIYINLFYNKELIIEHINKSQVLKEANVIIEQGPIDIGGAIHNFAKIVNYTGRLLILNCDQFILLKNEKLLALETLADQADSVLLTYDVYGRELYNETVISNSKLVGIRPNNLINPNEKIQTYTGVSIINLDKLTPCMGESKFFDSVANYKMKNIQTLNIENAVYWDFGTINRYYKSMFDILKKWTSKDLFIQFLKNNNGLDENLIHGDSYSCNGNRTINLSDTNCKNLTEAILLTPPKVLVPEQSCIVMDEIIEFVDQDLF
jgi:NDP-sugar pyrophosphorylase family protein